ncbi:MAG TPA: type VI secretion system tip protein TssI/VgrG, partial [Candidatus Eisenbacteria bacterium]
IRLEFQVKGLDPATFTPVKFEGVEAISELYRYEIDLVAPDTTEVDPDKVVGQPGVLTIDRAGDVTRFHGIVAVFELLGRGNNDATRFRVVMVPRLANLGLTKTSQVFLDKPHWKIVQAVLEENGLADGKDFDVQISEPGPTRDYVVQYQESDLDFIRRLMEYEGIFFFFRHDEEQEVMVLGSAKERHKPIEGEATVTFRDQRDVGPGGEAVGEFIYRQTQLSKDVFLKDYNYRKPTLEIKGTADVIPKGFGTFMEYGDHFKDPEDGKRLAAIRAQEQSCRQKEWFGRGAMRHFRAGSTFTLQDHFVTKFDGKYLITSVTHSAHQAGAVGGDTGPQGQRPGYLNHFVAIPADTLFIPRRITPRPRIWGYMKAQIDAGGSGDYAEIDDLGRYKVKLPFDLSDAKEGKASHFIRMAQPYSGGGMGMHFPLHKGTEVLLIHLDGDPDRPIIVGSVPNPDTMSPVTGANQTQCVIHTGGGNKIVIEDTDGGQRIAFSSPHSETFFSLGAAPE